MRKHVKLLVCAIAVVSMLVAMALPAFAATEGKITVSDTSLVTWAGLGNMGYQVKGGEESPNGCLGLGPVSPETAADAHITFKVTVDTAGTYTLTLRYAAKHGDGQTRKADVIVNDGERQNLKIEETTDWNVYTTINFEVTLKKGDNTVKFVNDAKFDNTTIKAINIDSLGYKLKTADAPETDAPTTDAPTTEAPGTSGGSSQQPTAPQTGFATVAIVAAIIGSGAYICSKKH